jgi:hypothetical protein
MTSGGFMNSDDPRLAALSRLFPGQAIMTHTVTVPDVPVPVLVIMVTERKET